MHTCKSAARSSMNRLSSRKRFTSFAFCKAHGACTVQISFLLAIDLGLNVCVHHHSFFSFAFKFPYSSFMLHVSLHTPCGIVTPHLVDAKLLEVDWHKYQTRACQSRYVVRGAYSRTIHLINPQIVSSFNLYGLYSRTIRVILKMSLLPLLFRVLPHT